MNITIITVGKIKEKYINMGIEEFSKRLRPYCRLKIIEVQDEPTPDKASPREVELIKEREGRRILSKLGKNSFVIPLVIKGKELSSEDFAEKISSIGLAGDSNISFIIGGSLGLADEVIARADFKLSFSKMTYPHQLMRLILLEQIYRAFRINTGAPYHK